MLLTDGLFHQQQIHGYEILKGVISMIRVRLTRLTGLMLFSLLAFPLFVCAQKGNTGQLKTKVNPGRAGVFVDGKYLGPAANFRIARTYSLSAGEHELLLTEPRYKDVKTKVTIQPGKTAKLEQGLKALPKPKPPFGRLRTVSADKYAAVYVNDKFMGHAGEFNNSVQGLKLNPGEYTVKIVPIGSEQGHEEKVRLEADKVTIVRFEK